MPQRPRGAGVYYETEVQSRTPLELVVMLYDGAIRFLTRCQDAMQAGDLVSKRDAMSRGLAIISELQNTLDMENGGEIAAELDRLYAYMTERLVEANTFASTDGVEECLRLLRSLRDAWALVAGKPSAAA